MLRFDNYGRGYSEAQDIPHDSALFVTQLVCLLAKLNLDKPLNLVGW